MKIALWLIMAIGFLLLGWYLFIKEYDYKFQFSAHSGKASVYQEIKNLEQFGLHNSGQSITIDGTSPYSQILQNISSKDTSISLEWNFKYQNDSLTRIEVNTIDHRNKLKNRFAILNPFKQSDYVKDLAQKFTRIKQKMDEKQKTYLVRTNGFAQSPEFTCVCSISKNIPLEEKAIEMVVAIEEIETYFVKYNLKLTDFPFLKVTDWNMSEEKIDFEFCFPVDVPMELEETDNMKIKTFPGLKSLKATFHGNYRESHLAWYELLEKGQRENISLDPKPLEVYHNNPRMGEHAISWKAEVYMPLKDF